MAKYTPSAWIKPRDVHPGTDKFSAWYCFKERKTSQSYKDVYFAATMASPDTRCMGILEDFSIYVAKLRLKRQL